MVYDFLADPAEIMVFDRPRGRFVLLDIGRRVQSELAMEDVKTFIDRAKKNLGRPKNPAEIRWLGEPAFDVTFDSPTSVLKLRSEWLTYEVLLLPTGPEVAAEYREFSDWDAQFNHVLNPRVAAAIFADDARRGDGAQPRHRQGSSAHDQLRQVGHADEDHKPP